MGSHSGQMHFVGRYLAPASVLTTFIRDRSEGVWERGYAVGTLLSSPRTPIENARGTRTAQERPYRAGHRLASQMKAVTLKIRRRKSHVEKKGHATPDSARRYSWRASYAEQFQRN